MIAASRTVLFAAVLGGVSLLAACGANPAPGSAPATAKKQEPTVISSTIQKAIVEAREEIAEGNITVSKDEHAGGTKAEITPKGDLLIDGRAVAVTAAQRALLLEYRGHVVEVATAGMNIGMESADLATRAVTESLKGVFTGNTDDVEKRVEAEADKVRIAAQQLCTHLPGMLASQQKLAAALPEFKPYATMEADDVDDCWKETRDHDKTTAAAAETSKG
jgi:DNA-directed RNA polymerase subunit K/omega